MPSVMVCNETTFRIVRNNVAKLFRPHVGYELEALIATA